MSKKRKNNSGNPAKKKQAQVPAELARTIIEGLEFERLDGVLSVTEPDGSTHSIPTKTTVGEFRRLASVMAAIDDLPESEMFNVIADVIPGPVLEAMDRLDIQCWLPSLLEWVEAVSERMGGALASRR